MSLQPAPTASRQIVWGSVITVLSAAILIGAEVFGAAFAPAALAGRKWFRRVPPCPPQPDRSHIQCPMPHRRP